MRHDVRLCEDDTTCEALGSFLEERIYEFNSKVTGYVDGRLLAGCVRNEMGEVIAGFNGYTWGGSCELTNVWVHEQHRGQGLGAHFCARLKRKPPLAVAYASFLLHTTFKRPASTSAWATSERTPSRRIRAASKM